MNSLKVKDLCKTYIINKMQNNVLRNLNFEINEGEMVAIMGPSGSGKSTLLYTVSGMDHLTAGKVDYFGKEISTLTPNEMSDLRLDEMGFIFQQMHMLKNLSIYDNIILPAYHSKKGKDRKAINERARVLMHKLGINEVADNATNEVSGGELQRACICRSLINSPKMIFADEPTGALNLQNSYEVMKELNKINQEGTTIMLVTHDMKVAAKCDRIMYIQDGSIKGEIHLGKFEFENSLKERERMVNNWLMEMGW
ncbi:putative ABC transport system ATP-binding protein [Natranaerovirga pectinivora]|uniref:Putative ABC transport system ATP-binding protein n=1 Tax=Natranaerovirga pectinivora TaxID=682400 RepID=A0A4R3MPM8_9FIRM|nr:ABC transporter ATP-binding protein [Natranaerovirga pectinivora]TCT16231.1 putative ABC transport system ATP-binding protein [Natranaerovirga pectinivora]